jgi:ABC-type sugar transport system ATPase subunit
MPGGERDGSKLMARIDLINVGKTLRDRERAGPGTVTTQTVPDVVPAARGGGRGSGFSIQNLNLRIPDGETMVILGPSGCGKTTLLKIIAGLIPPDSGEVRYADVDVRDVPPGDRRIGMVFQNYALYPHLSSRANVLSYFLFRKKTPELDAMARAKYQRTSELMGVDLAYLLDRRPTTLSGGEKQRVALGRCITRDPALFLLDEPFSNLDQALREKYRVNLKILLRQFNITTVYVTHDHYEALILADRLAIMDRGRIEQVGTYEEIYNLPRNVFVAGFLNRHLGSVPIGLVDARDMAGGRRLGDVRVGVRPEDLEVSREARDDSTRGVIAGKLSVPLLNATVLSIQVGEHEVHAQTSGDSDLLIGDPVWLTFRRYHVFDKESGVRLHTHPDATAVTSIRQAGT